MTFTMTKKYLFLLSFAVLSVVGYGQSCSGPGQLCAGDAVSGTFDALTPVDFDCFNYSYTLYYTFTTNSDAENPGTVTVDIDGIDCSSAGGAQEVHAVIAGIEAGGDICVPITYQALSDCGSGVGPFSLTSEVLEPSTEYIVIVGTELDPVDGPCSFNITISGAAVSLNACCDALIVAGEQIELSVAGGNDADGFTWIPAVEEVTPSGSEVLATPIETVTFTVTGNVGPCENLQDFLTVTVGPPLRIPNTFTPNDDGINDLWRIGNVGQFPNIQVTVFDRWGQVVFKDIGYAQPWDGRNNDRKLPTATYYYVIELNSDVVEIPPITGHVSLIH